MAVASVAGNNFRKRASSAASLSSSPSSSLTILFAVAALVLGRASPSSSSSPSSSFVPPSLPPLRTAPLPAVPSVQRSRAFGFCRPRPVAYGRGGTVLAAPYGRGAEIWPQTNEDSVIRLEDSFPNGSLPPRAAAAFGRRFEDSIVSSSSSSSVGRADDVAVAVDGVPDDDEGEEDDGASSSSSAPTPTTADGEASAVPPVPPPPPTAASPPGRKRRLVRRAVKRILRGAASSQEAEAFESRSEPTATSSATDALSSSSSSSALAKIDLIPGVVALLLLVGRLVRPIDVLAAVFLSGYFLVLGEWCRSPRPGGKEPSLPSLPPQGHVPSLVSNPLGQPFTDSDGYRMWLKIGSVVGVLGPALAVLWYGCPSIPGGVEESLGRVLPGWLGRAIAGRRCAEAVAAAARPAFLVCCQAVCEAIGRRVMAPLPLRILIPVSYNALRLGPLWDWALLSCPLGAPGRILAIVNLLYWSANLFGFLIPTATMRYLRAHFFCVEASEVMTRKGGEGAVGLLP